MACEHPLDAAFLYPSDVDILEFVDDAGTTVLRVAFPCPECGQALEADLPVTETAESSLELPVEDVEEQYD
ncbi:hypothetical protein [Halorarius litoreus]|uniref:hypothetical protein n=1 Tax=Halorarius litoreus TaxID=2962676 RepID=UPI0020CB8AD2|nr:hypothetical protein [Halorarius litoreus]